MATDERELVLQALHEERRKRACEASLSEFIKDFWEIIEPGVDLIWNWHIDVKCKHLEAITAGEVRRLVVNEPPRYMKSIVVTIMWPCWEWIHIPEQRWIFWSYSGALSAEHGISRKTIMTSEKFQRRWGDRVKLTSEAASSLRNSARGVMWVTSVGGTATGMGGNRLVIDDPLNPKQAASEADLRHCTEFMKVTMPSRLDDKKRGAIILIMQRLHEEDPTGLVLSWGGWMHLCLPCEFEPDSRCTNAIFEDPRQDLNELLWPEREGPDEVGSMKQALGTYGYAGQYQQRPAPSGGGIYRQEWFRYWTWHPEKGSVIIAQAGREQLIISVQQLTRFIVVDLAVSTKEESDYTVIALWGCYGKYLFLLDRIRDRFEAPELIPAIKDMYVAQEFGGGGVVYIEATQFQASVVQYALQAGLPAAELRPDRDKRTRAMGCAPKLERGEVFFPAFATWLTEWEQELGIFPAGKYDDQADVLAYAELVSRSIMNSHPPVIFESRTTKNLFDGYRPTLQSASSLLASFDEDRPRNYGNLAHISTGAED